jgi:hypothetical protein
MVINGIFQDAEKTIPVELVIQRDGSILTNLWGGPRWRKITHQPTIDWMNTKRETLTKKEIANLTGEWQSLQQKNANELSEEIHWLNKPGKIDTIVNSTADVIEPANTPPPKPPVDKTALCQKMVKFFSDFEFTPQVRLLNSLGNLQSEKEIKDYLRGYFELTNNNYRNDLVEKMKSEEFSDMVKDLIGLSTKKINKRFEVYYGEPGGGKTTTAIKNNPEAEVVVCHAGMTPDELFRGFDFTDGKPTFKSCPVKEAMLNGKVVILDEINLLNEDCRRTLQAILDEKTEVVINSETIHIKDGFKIIGTMNLTVNEMVFPLPAPLVDRAEVIKEFSMTASKLASLAF